MLAAMAAAGLAVMTLEHPQYRARLIWVVAAAVVLAITLWVGLGATVVLA